METLWDSWQRDIQRVETLKIPRCIMPTRFDVRYTELHIFSDASEVGYGSVVYLRCIRSSGMVCCNFLIGKSRVAPMKPVTIPRLELQAAVLSVRLKSLVLRELFLKIDSTYLWTDFMIVLHYINNRK
ncbi:hypothetical protein CLF_110267, partial [Clonorchis sinensis]